METKLKGVKGGGVKSGLHYILMASLKEGRRGRCENGWRRGTAKQGMGNRR
jgi:hypothetical protein